MDVLQEMESKKQQFSNIEDRIQEHQNTINELKDELKRLQGDYRMLVRLGQEQGLIDDQGNIVSEE